MADKQTYSREELTKMRASELKLLLHQFGLTSHGCLEKKDFVDRILEAVEKRVEAADKGEASNTATSPAAQAVREDTRAAPGQMGKWPSSNTPAQMGFDPSAGQRKFEFFKWQNGRTRTAAAETRRPQKSATQELQEVRRELQGATRDKDMAKADALKRRQDLLETLAMEELDDGREENDDIGADDEASPSFAERRMEYNREELEQMRISELRALVRAFGLSGVGCFAKDDFVNLLMSLASAEQAEDSSSKDHAQHSSRHHLPAEGTEVRGREEPPESREELLKMSVIELRALMAAYGLSSEGCIAKSDFVDRLKRPQGSSQSRDVAEAPEPRSAWPEQKIVENITVTVRLREKGFEAWRRVLTVPADTHIGAFRTLLSASPNDLPVTLRTRFLAPGSDEILPNRQLVVSDMILTNFHPEKVDVRVRSSLTGMQDWQVQAEVPIYTTTQEFKAILRAPPYELPIPEHQQVWHRPLHYNSFSPAEDSEPVLPEVVLIDFVVPRATENQDEPEPEHRQPASPSRLRPSPDRAATQKPAGEATGMLQELPRMQEDDPASSSEPREYWRHQQELCTGLERVHAKQGPRTRRAYSWARSVAFAQIALGNRLNGQMRQGTESAPFIIWVLGATDATEGSLAEAGFFDDSNWVNWAPTKVVIFGNGLRKVVPSESHAKEGHPPLIRTMAYEDMGSAKVDSPPDLVAVFMPQLPCPEDSVQVWETESGWSPVPDAALVEVGSTPIVMTFRSELPQSALVSLRRQLGFQLLLDQTRCPFSSSAGAEDQRFDDNGWLIAVSGHRAVATVLNLEADIASHRPMPEDHHELLTGLFWGIIDLKYDPKLPVLERVRVLETGDGRISKFSNDGAQIKELFDQLYKLKPGPAQQKHIVVSSDKKLTHDLIDKSGYGHILPQQVCFPRHHTDALAREIAEGLGLKDSDNNDIVVLKLCNRSRGAGVLVVPISELDEVLDEILTPPADVEAWLKAGTDRIALSAASDLGIDRNSFDEQRRHWWGNESPVFVAEKYCGSTPTVRRGKSFDGTLRVSFVIRHKQRGSSDTRQARRAGANPSVQAMPPAEELEIEWLGGYWKLPKADADSADLRGRSVSAARSGTAPVRPAHLQEVYAALGDSMQQLFGGAEPTPQELRDWYQHQPEIAAFLIARLGMSGQKFDAEKAQTRLNIAQIALDESTSPAKKCVYSYLCRARGIAEIKTNIYAAGIERWRCAEEYFRKSVEVLPRNANALFWLGLAALEDGKLDEAVDLMNCSLLLDPDFKGPYVNLGVAYLRQGKYHRCIEISNACLARHPDTPMCNYHIGVASYQTAMRMYEQPDENVTANGNLNELLDLSLGLCADELSAARESELGQKRAPSLTGRHESPWLEADDQMLAEALALEGSRSPAPRCIEVPPSVGWRSFVWRA